jgi:hypothetical protein
MEMQKHKERNVQLVSRMYFYIKKSIVVELIKTKMHTVGLQN